MRVFARQLTALPLRPDQMNAHRHMHNSSSQGMQSFHKDSQRNKPPNHLPRSLFVFYYAGGCSDEMGPTEIVPKSQFLGADDQDWSGVNETPTNLGPTIGSTRLTSPANRPVAVISHHAMIHRGCARLSDELDDESAPWRPSEPSTLLAVFWCRKVS